jgi:pilus assembly protein FimV
LNDISSLINGGQARGVIDLANIKSGPLSLCARAFLPVIAAEAACYIVTRTTPIDITARMKALYRVLALAAPMVVQFSSAWALSVGQVRANAVLGQPLSLAVPVTVAEGEELIADCVSADIIAGDYKVPPQNVRTRVSPGRTATEGIVRITTTGVVEEPVLSVTVSVGCTNKASRTVTLFADPPPVSLPETLPPVAASAPAAQSAAQPAEPDATTAPAPRATPAPVVRKAVPRRSPSTAAVITPPRARIVARPARAPAGTEVPSSAQAPVPPTSLAKPVPAQPPAGAASAGRPALKLEAVAAESGASEANKASTSQATAMANAALAAAEAASAAQARLKVLEEELAKLRLQSKQQAEQYTAMQAQLSKPRAMVADERVTWLVPLLGAMAGVFGLTSLWLWLRSRRVASRDAAWWDAQSEERDSESAKHFSHSRTAIVPRVSRQSASDADAEGSAESRLSTHMPGGLVPDSIAPSRGLDSMMSPRTVQGAPRAASAFAPPAAQQFDTAAFSVDEQIDVEQQADFFIALGHDDEAIDLLMANLRSTGGGSPLPYLKLLEIHRRLGQREDYERTRDRFNQRFNSVAPDWSTDPHAGRALEQYPMVMGRIQHAWTSPLDAMVELEALLFGRSDNAEVFDLPAYQEVLLLYQVARELHTSEPSAGRSDDVDVLLPIGGPSNAGAPASGEGTIVLRPEFNAGRHVTLDLELESRPGSLGGDVKVIGSVPSSSRPSGRTDES